MKTLHAFVAMSFGKKTGPKGTVINFDAVNRSKLLNPFDEPAFIQKSIFPRGQSRRDRYFLQTVPEALLELPGLIILNLAGNNLSSLPSWVTELQDLQMIDLSNNQLNTLPEPLGQLLKLQQLDVSNNQLSAFPESLGNCSELQELDIAFNNVEALPKSLVKLPLRVLLLQGNQRLGIDPRLLGKYPDGWERRESSDYISVKPSTIFEAYFATFEKDGRPLNEVKLLLVGRGAAGKTTLARRLVKGTFSRNPKETQGIDISKWTLPCGEQEVTLNLWDFAGQVITHATHQLFLSSNSVYVLVLTGREDTQKSDADYWLRLIRAFGCDGFGNTSPVLIALNKWVQHPFKLECLGHCFKLWAGRALA